MPDKTHKKPTNPTQLIAKLRTHFYVQLVFASRNARSSNTSFATALVSLLLKCFLIFARVSTDLACPWIPSMTLSSLTSGSTLSAPYCRWSMHKTITLVLMLHRRRLWSRAEERGCNVCREIDNLQHHNWMPREGDAMHTKKKDYPAT